MDNRHEVRDFLTPRRERLTPEQAGVPFFGGKRRVKGLRREEVAMLAGMSTDYYTRLERGNLSGVSESVLDALARALQLDEAERAHLFNLAATASSSTQAAESRASRRPANRTGVRQGVQRILDTINAPAYVRNGRTDIVATNRLGRALFADAYGGGDTFNLARYLFLDPGARDFFVEWETVAVSCVAALRAEAGRNPYDRGLTDLIGQLSTRSDEFRTWWATHNVNCTTRPPRPCTTPSLATSNSPAKPSDCRANPT
jgi:transcriptional regulator with XRE-family HTH domain